MDTTTTLLLVVGAIIGSGLGYAFLSSRAFDKKHSRVPQAENLRNPL